MEHLQDMIHFYENEGQEELRLSDESVQNLEYLTAIRYLDKYLGKESTVLDSCAGTGIYSFYLAGQGHRVSAGDIVPYNVEIMREKQMGQPPLAEVYQGDARDLSSFADASFDAALCMGALYHLPDEKDRRTALAESLRVLRPGGLLFATYINRYAVILNNLEKDLRNIDDVMQFARSGQEGIYYASNAGEMESLATACGFTKRAHIALDGPALLLRHTAALLDDEGFARWKQYHFAVCEDASLLGSSYHNLYIGAKEA